MKRLIAVLMLITTIPACNGLTGAAVSLLKPGGGPSVSANVQAGQNNAQTVGTTRVSTQKTGAVAGNLTQSSDANQVRAQQISSVHVTNIDPWVLGLLLLFAGIVIPSPGEMARGIRNLFRRKPNG